MTNSHTTDTDSMTAATTGWEAGTARWQPSRRAQATASLVAADRLTGDAHREAIQRHFEEFVPPRACPVHG